jgi:Transglycosylase SLT domain
VTSDEAMFRELLRRQSGERGLAVDPKGYVDLSNPFFRQLETERNLPVGLISGMAEKESTGNAFVKARDPKSSSAGLFQINKRTAKDWGLTEEERYDPMRAAVAAADVLAKRAAKYGIERAVGMHYGGPGAPYEETVGSSGESPRSYSEKVFELARKYATP